MKPMKLMGYVLGSVALIGCGLDDESIATGNTTQAASAAAKRVLIGFAPGAKAGVKQAVTASGGNVHVELDAHGAIAVTVPEAALAGLAANPNVQYVEDDALRSPSGVGQLETSPYGIAMVQADLVPDTMAGSRKLCIIDSGYSWTHEDLPKTSVTGSADDGWKFDDCGHGTHVAGTIAALGLNGTGVVGVAPSGNLNLHIVKVFGGESCAWTYSSSLVAAADECVAAGANVISMSLGGGGATTAEQNAFSTYWAQGILSIAAAGNDGTSVNTTDALSYPASYASVMSVAAIDSNKALAAFSQENSAVDIAAPGVAVESTLSFVDDSRLLAGTTAFVGSHIEGSAWTSASGVDGSLVDGGLCTKPTQSWSGKVVLCQRGSNTLASKVGNVRKGAGRAAIIYNSAASDPSCGGLSGWLGGATSPTPAIGLSCADGAAARAHLGQTVTLVSERLLDQSNYEAWNGTSMATPHVSGVAALVWSHDATKTNAQVRAALESSAQDLGAAGRDNSFGYGLVQAATALDHLLNGPPPPPPGDTTPPAISSVASSTTNKRGGFKITWTTDEASDSAVRFDGASSFTNASMVTSHSMSFTGTKGATYTYYVSSSDAAGNTTESGPYTHQN